MHAPSRFAEAGGTRATRLARVGNLDGAGNRNDIDLPAPLAYWNFDDNVADQTGNGNDGDVHGAIFVQGTDFIDSLDV